ncbi:MAG TPA: hypothetical protein VHC18_14980 [Amycolatopsis sp.]|nr:hypothetical protein [Amycolatopsis sp.]
MTTSDSTAAAPRPPLVSERLILRGWQLDYVDEVYAVVRPGKTRAADTVRNGMHWVGETSKYFGLTLQVFRLRSADLDQAAPNALLPPRFGTN